MDVSREKLKSTFSCSCTLPLLLSRSCLLLLLLFVQVRAQTPGWTKQPAGTMAWLHSVFFLDENRGWVVGSKGTLLATLDGGKTWQAKPASTDVLRDIYFTDDQNGWLVCEKNIYDLKEKDEPRTYLMQTTDGGENWKRINIRGIDVDIRLVACRVLTRWTWLDVWRSWFDLYNSRQRRELGTSHITDTSSSPRRYLCR